MDNRGHMRVICRTNGKDNGNYYCYSTMTIMHPEPYILDPRAVLLPGPQEVKHWPDSDRTLTSQIPTIRSAYMPILSGSKVIVLLGIGEV